MHRSLRAAATLATLAALAACADAPSAPATTADLAQDAATAALVNAPAAAPIFPKSAATGASLGLLPTTTVSLGDTAYVSFTVQPSQDGLYPLGRHWIYFQAGSICDPNVTNYGPGTWNQSCQPAAYPVALTAKVYRDAEGRPVVDFSKHLRFVPTKSVILHMTFDASFGEPTIDWLPSRNASAVNESSDPALVARQGNTYMVFRRIKHFSGYIVTTGRVSAGSSIGVELALKHGGTTPIVPEGLGNGHVVATGATGGEQQRPQ